MEQWCLETWETSDQSYFDGDMEYSPVSGFQCSFRSSAAPATSGKPIASNAADGIGPHSLSFTNVLHSCCAEVELCVLIESLAVWPPPQSSAC